MNDEDSLKSSESKESLIVIEVRLRGLAKQEDSGQDEPGTTKELQKHCIRRRPESGEMPHSACMQC